MVDEDRYKTFDVYMPNADICWFILNFAQKESSLYTKAESMVQRMLDLFLSQKEVEPHSLESMMFLLRELQKTEAFADRRQMPPLPMNSADAGID